MGIRILVNCTPRHSSGTLRTAAPASPRIVLLFVGLTVVVVYMVLLGLLWMQQERVVFQPPLVLSSFATKRDARSAVRQVSYRADDGTEVFGFLVGELHTADQLLIAFHGNADLARNLIPWAQTVMQVTRV